LKPKVRLIIAVVCWVGGFLSLINGMGMGMMSQWAGWGGEGFLALGNKNKMTFCNLGQSNLY